MFVECAALPTITVGYWQYCNGVQLSFSGMNGNLHTAFRGVARAVCVVFTKLADTFGDPGVTPAGVKGTAPRFW